MTSQTPTIVHLKTHSLDGLFATCANAGCLHSVTFTFAALELDDDVQFPSIARRRRFVCTQRGSRDVNLMPDWRRHKAHGNGSSDASATNNRKGA